MKKALVIIAMILAVALLLPACGEKKDAPDTAEPKTTVSEDTKAESEEIADTADVNADDTTEEATEPEDTTEEVPEEVERPSADGQEVRSYDLSFYLPDFLTANEYNGMLGVYEFYTGDFSGSKPSGIDFTLVTYDESEANGDLRAYARDEVGIQVEPEEVDFNGTTWLRYTVDEGHVGYFVIFNTVLYKITTEMGSDTKENYDAARAMFEETLFLAETDW
ncbi:MAG: hypothetical protein IJQ80_07145 [Clostridia bacterium]|nr:hypothetical protein [Clostridia bacterium]